jgi:cobalamin biosynthesis protein CobT
MSEQEQKLAEEETVRQNTEEKKAQIQSILDSYPVYIAKEDNFIFIEQMQAALNIKFSSINISDITEFYDTEMPVLSEDGSETDSDTSDSENTASSDNENQTDSTDGTLASDTDAANSQADTTATDAEGTDADGAETTNDETMKGMQTTISLSFMTTYDGLKELVDYIKNYPDKTVIDSTSVNYDNTTGELTGSLVIKRYSLTGTGKKYEAPYIEDISIGTDNIFGTNPDQTNLPDQTDQTNSGDQTGLPAE